MRRGFLTGLTVILCVLAGAGPAAADSTVNFPNAPTGSNNSVSLTLSLGGGALAFVFIDNAGSGDIFAQVVNAAGNLAQVTFNNTFTAYAFWFKFEGLTQGFKQYGVYLCASPAGQTCNVSTVRRGTLFL